MRPWRRSNSANSCRLSSPGVCLNDRGRGSMTYLLLPRGCRLVLQALASRINVQNAGCPPPSFDVQQPQLDNTRASSMITAADTHNKATVGCLSRTLGVVKLGAIIKESHTTPITFNEASGRRCRYDALRPANPTTRSSDLGLEIPVPISDPAPDLHRLSARCAINFHFPFFFSPQNWERMRWPVLAIVLDVICDSRG